jgi:hypothetical protein
MSYLLRRNNDKKKQKVNKSVMGLAEEYNEDMKTEILKHMTNNNFNK